MRRHMRLDEDDRLLRVESRRQPIQRDLQRILFYARGVGVVGCQCVPVRYFKETFVLILHAHPVVERAHVVSEMQLSSRAHAAEHAFTKFSGRYHLSQRDLVTDSKTESKSPRTGQINRPRSPPPR